MVTLIFWRGLYGHIWVNILTLSPPRVPDQHLKEYELVTTKVIMTLLMASLIIQDYYYNLSNLGSRVWCLNRTFQPSFI